MEQFDLYTIKARLFPAIIAVVPAIALAVALIEIRQFDFSQIWATIGLGVLLYVFSGIAREAGKRVERRMFRENGGKPTFDVLQYDDREFSDTVKKRYLSFLSNKVSRPFPTMADVLRDPAAAREFYNESAAFLRENTRDTERFRVLFEENVSYGFYRNLLGLKWPAIVLNILVSLTAFAFLVDFHGPWSFDSASLRYVLVAAAMHLAYLLLWVTEKRVLYASRRYSRQLALACEVL
ncbi:hypothetical protein [Sinorhizobium meliloti]|uniref:hypothetical protein n=1 Tax=Rhizobium meliloti TaxID=382 RepID=UPI000FDCD46C|nr:hypothetical protein [Sinorhizobium meliloti]RVK96131.1 hypothetical protein CN152_19765 [Sinorhizobium meliloti]RVN50942.1 hypothetical protein CN113_04045 [Sinorhizobium meliloti]